MRRECGGRAREKKQHVPRNGLLSLWGHHRGFRAAPLETRQARRRGSTADTLQPSPEDPALGLQGPTSSWACGAPPVPYSDIHLATLPPEHTVVFLLRLLPETPREAFALWQVASEDFQPILGVLLDGQLEGKQWVRRCSGGGSPPAFHVGVSCDPCPIPQLAGSR